jgi:GNAT superfamily N-acetyltransferase
MPQPTFRLATHDDLGAILALLADDDVARSRTGYQRELTPAVIAAFNAIDADPNNELWVGVLDGQVIATLQLTVIPGLSRGGLRRALIEAVRVRSDLRGQGVGDQLMRATIARARHHGCGLLQLTTDTRRTAAQRFYQRLGFEPSHVGMKLLL